MRARAVTAFGWPEVLQFSEVPEAQAGPGQVVIRVAYAGVNFVVMMGMHEDFHANPLPFVPGLEVSGHIYALGEGVWKRAAGDMFAEATDSSSLFAFGSQSHRDSGSAGLFLAGLYTFWANYETGCPHINSSVH